MLKMGTYGFMRFVLPLFPAAVEAYSGLFFLLGVIGIIYGALVAMVQPDMKKLVAYSSVSHMGYVMIGLFAMNSYGLTGGLYQMLNHGVSTGALFFLVGMIYERTHSREISKYGGLAMAMPLYTICFFIVTLSSIAVPGTNGFIGEFLILLGTFEAHNWYGAAGEAQKRGDRPTSDRHMLAYAGHARALGIDPAGHPPPEVGERIRQLAGKRAAFRGHPADRLA
jgi:NADH:ubiquinone oxidoreductase subunit 4 (subunit M)